MGYNATLLSVARAARELGVEYIDLMLCHYPAAAQSDYGSPKAAEARHGTWRALLHARWLGLVRHVGVANWEQHEIEAASAGTAGELPEVLQLEFHPWSGPHVASLVRWSQSTGIAVTAFGSLGSASYQRGEPLPAALTQQMARLAAVHPGRTQSQLLLRYALDEGVAAIPASRSEGHMRENLDLGGFALAASERRALEAAPPPRTWQAWSKLTSQVLHGARGGSSNSGVKASKASHSATKTTRNCLDKSLEKWFQWSETTWRWLEAQTQPRRIFDAHGWAAKDGSSDRPTRAPTHPCTLDGPSNVWAARVAAAIQMNKRPFFVLPPGLVISATQCNATRDCLVRLDKGRCLDKSNGGDLRLYRLESMCAGAAAQKAHPFLGAVARRYLKLPKADVFNKETVLGGIARRGSVPGGGWHTDTNEPHGFKALTYLSDVRRTSSPFTMLVNYGRLGFEAHACTHKDYVANRNDSVTNKQSNSP